VIEELAPLFIPFVRVTGNGPGEKSTGDTPALDVAFNLPRIAKPIGNQVFIRNNRVAKSDHKLPLTVESLCLTTSTQLALQQKLRATSEELTLHLGCLPSSGLAAVACFSDFVKMTQVDCLPLIPSFARPANMNSRKPQACAFHNWLGERRLAMELQHLSSPERIRWPGFHFNSDCDGSEQSDPLQRLLSVFDEKRPSKHIRLELQALSTACNDSWLASLSLSTLEQLEAKFFLQRNVQHTAQWWLYDNEASSAIDRIFKRLIWCQQTLAK
tara:strand:- start:5504 stop:6316 length:813 start_codon:yes stop_codon:yes gene_type:complete